MTSIFPSSRLLRPAPRLNPVLPLLLLLGLSACAQEKIKQYRVAKVAIQTSFSKGPLSYTVPPGWEKQPAAEMRLASFKIAGGGDFSVVSLPGMAGDLKSNLNRWRGQVGLPPLTDAGEIQRSVTPVTIDGTKATALELYSPAGTPDKAMRVVLMEKDGATWFFKLAGPGSLVKAQKAAFESFNRSVRIKPADGEDGSSQLPPMGQLTNKGGTGSQMPPMAEAQTSQESDTSSMGPNHPSVDGDPPADSAMGQPPGGDMAGTPMAPAKTDTTLSWMLPAGWKEKAAGMMRVASFDAPQGGDVSIVNLSGDGGGLLNNVNRWRAQMGLAAIEAKDLDKEVRGLDLVGTQAAFMTLYTAGKDKGMMVVLLSHAGQTWFVKLAGPGAAIPAQQAGFLAFVKSIRFHAKESST